MSSIFKIGRVDQTDSSKDVYASNSWIASFQTQVANAGLVHAFA